MKNFLLLLTFLPTINLFAQPTYVVHWFSQDYPSPPPSAVSILEQSSSFVSRIYEMESDFPIPFFNVNANSFLVYEPGVFVIPANDTSNFTVDFSMGILCRFHNGFFTQFFSDYLHWVDGDLGNRCHYFQVINAGHCYDMGWPLPIMNHSINFTIKLCEDSKIELIYGENDLENLIYFREGEGFLFQDGEPYGCFVSISNPEDEDHFYYITGNPDSILVTSDPNLISNFPYMMPKGFTFQFSLKSLNVREHNKNLGYKFYPNPINDFLYLSRKNEEKHELFIVDLLGNTIISRIIDSENHYLDLSGIKPGIYFIQIFDKSRVLLSQKIFKL